MSPERQIEVVQGLACLAGLALWVVILGVAVGRVVLDRLLRLAVPR